MVGIGNVDRQDDGVGWHVLDLISARLGGPETIFPESEIVLGNGRIVLQIVLQLTPEMAETVAQHERVCFVDAHTGEIPHPRVWQELTPSFQVTPFTHHFTPSSCLALAQSLYNSRPEAIQVSIRGYQFGFSRSLSPETSRLAQAAARDIVQWLFVSDDQKLEGKNEDG